MGALDLFFVWLDAVRLTSGLLLTGVCNVGTVPNAIKRSVTVERCMTAPITASLSAELLGGRRVYELILQTQVVDDW